MENNPTRKRRFQFSLGTLLMGVIATGAFTGMFFNYRENVRLREVHKLEVEKLQAEVYALREENGYLNIDDPKKGWARSVNTDEPYKWRFRVYVPHAGLYRIGVQTQDVAPTGIAGIDRIRAHYTTVHINGAGEFRIDARALKMPNDRGEFELSIPHSSVTIGAQQSSGWTIDLKKNGFTTWQFETINGSAQVYFKSTSFELDKPFILLSLKTMKITKQISTPTQHDQSSSGTSEPSPGIQIWLEEVAPN